MGCDVGLPRLQDSLLDSSCRWAATLLIGLVIATTSRAQAKPTPIELRWSAPQECPDDLALLHAVEGFLGESLERAGEQPVAINTHVQGDPAHGYAARLEFVTARGSSERSIQTAAN